MTTPHRAAALALDEALAKVGVEKIAPAARGADRFDPALHEATYPVPVQAASGADGTSDSGGGGDSSGAAAVVAPGTIMELLQARARALFPLHACPVADGMIPAGSRCKNVCLCVSPPLLLQAGYALHGKVLRPARVGVAVLEAKSPPPSAPSAPSGGADVGPPAADGSSGRQ